MPEAFQTIVRRLSEAPNLALAAATFAALAARLAARFTPAGAEYACPANYALFVFAVLLAGSAVSSGLACWIWGGFCFVLLRAYLSAVDLRIQDRYAAWVAYLTVPFMLYYVHTDWYNMFIVTVPVYAFLVIPLAVAAGGRPAEGTVYAIGAICFGLFLFVYCVGHFVYLARYSPSMAGVLMLGIALTHAWGIFLRDRKPGGIKGAMFAYALPALLMAAAARAASPWTGLTPAQSAAAGLMIPALVLAGNFTIRHVEADLKLDAGAGRGRLTDSARGMLYSAPVILHYYRYFAL